MTTENPYASPSSQPASDGPRFRLLAVPVGFLADIVFTGVGSVGLGIVGGALLVGQGIPMDRLEAELNSLTWFWVLGLLLGFCGSVFGGYVAAWMGRDFPLRHAIAAGSVSLLFGMVPSFFWENMGPMWATVAGLALTLPAALLGGYLRGPRSKRMR